MQRAAENTQNKAHKTASIFEFLKSEANVERPRYDEEIEEVSSTVAQVDIPEVAVDAQRVSSKVCFASHYNNLIKQDYLFL